MSYEGLDYSWTSLKKMNEHETDIDETMWTIFLVEKVDYSSKLKIRGKLSTRLERQDSFTQETFSNYYMSGTAQKWSSLEF